MGKTIGEGMGGNYPNKFIDLFLNRETADCAKGLDAGTGLAKACRRPELA